MPPRAGHAVKQGEYMKITSIKRALLGCAVAVSALLWAGCSGGATPATGSASMKFASGDLSDGSLHSLKTAAGDKWKIPDDVTLTSLTVRLTGIEWADTATDADKWVTVCGDASWNEPKFEKGAVAKNKDVTVAQAKSDDVQKLSSYANDLFLAAGAANTCKKCNVLIVAKWEE